MHDSDAKSDWWAFQNAVPWFGRGKARDATIRPVPPRLLDDAAAELFPALGELLAAAAVTDVELGGKRYELLAWTSKQGERFGWLCMPPVPSPSALLHQDHQELLRAFGGTIERFNEPDNTWLLNLNDALTERASTSITRDAFAQALEQGVPVDVEAHYPIAVEANGNLTLCHRETGTVLMFAHDHSFKHITVLEGCPKYTFYTINGVSVFREWVEAIARQWLEHVR